MSETRLSPAEIEILYSADAIAERIDALARQIADAAGHQLLVISVLTGSFMFSADLLRALCKAGVAPEVDFLSLSSYRRETSSSGRVEIVRDLEINPAGRNVLLVDDILDTGRTLAYAKDLINARGARQLRTCVLLNKRVPRAVSIEADYAAFQCPAVFVVGYGMDLAHRYRELPFVGMIISEQ